MFDFKIKGVQFEDLKFVMATCFDYVSVLKFQSCVNAILNL
jgi:hypothetical protein